VTGTIPAEVLTFKGPLGGHYEIPVPAKTVVSKGTIQFPT
jgi:hypothetical protein